MRDRHVAVADGTRLAYRDFGPMDGAPIVLCHGLAAGGAQFWDDASYFSDLGYRVLVPDLRGHGASGVREPITNAQFTIGTMSGDLERMLDDAEVGPVHWVGNSLGGILAFDLVARAPERFASLATFGTAHTLNLPVASGRAIPLLYGVFGAGLMGHMAGVTTTAQKSARPLVAKMVAAFNPAVGRAIAANIHHYDLTAAALGYDGPMLVIVGGRDRAVNLALRKSLPKFAGRSRFSRVDLPDGGHCANLDASAAWRSALLRFWGNSPEPSAE